MKRLATIITILKVLISVTGALMFIGWLIAPASWPKPVSYLTTIVLPYIPDLFQLIKVKFSLPLTIAYEIFLIVSMVLGVDLNWYSQVFVTTSQDSYFDKIVHFTSGILVALVANELFLLHAGKAHNHPSAKWFQALFLIGAVSFVAVGWECYEFLYDQLFGGNMQELVKSGVADTMWDMIVSLLGGAICTVCLIQFQNLSKK